MEDALAENKFQSTLPLRGATLLLSHAPESLVISIHTPLAGSDAISTGMPARLTYFNPHSPCGERRPARSASKWPGYFNPHSPCGERPCSSRMAASRRNFNPHSPCGERRTDETPVPTYDVFQSTLPLRGATVFSLRVEDGAAISIHTPLAGSDFRHVLAESPHLRISIHTPLAGSDRPHRQRPTHNQISIHTPLAGSDP